jgi:GNAT superfamily N-acetyltransferase
MADATIDIVGMEELPLVAQMFNQVFRPPRDAKSFERRFLGRHNPLIMIAYVDESPAGFFLGFEQKPGTFFAWFYGVIPDHRRSGIGSQLMEAAQNWAQEQGYESIRLECQNSHRPMLHLATALGYDIVGLRWDTDLGTNLVMFEKSLVS